MMQKELIEPMIKGVLNEHGLEYSTGGLKSLLRDSKFLKQRSAAGYSFLGRKGQRYLHQYIYYNYLSNEDKKFIYGSCYELGSQDKVLNSSEKELFDYLYDSYGGEDTAGIVKEIKKMISEITGLPFKDFLKQDRDLAYKIISMFYRLIREYNSKLKSFLTKPFSGKAEFEYRSKYPMHTQNRAVENTCIMDEILTYLLFSMPGEYREVAENLRTSIAEVGNETGKLIGELLNYCGYYENDALVENLTLILSREKQEKKNSVAIERLDFMLYVSIVLREVSFRNKSWEIVFNTMIKNNLDLNPIYKIDTREPSDSKLLEAILGHSSFELNNKLERKAQFIHHLIRLKNPRKELPRLNKLLIKAIIIHDESHSIEISSKVIGVSSLQKSVRTVLTDVAKHEEIPHPNEYPEALVQYWLMRYQYATHLMGSTLELNKGKTYIKKQELELLSDEGLYEYVRECNLTNLKELYLFPQTLAEKLGILVVN